MLKLITKNIFSLALMVFSIAAHAQSSNRIIIQFYQPSQTIINSNLIARLQQISQQKMTFIRRTLAGASVFQFDKELNSWIIQLIALQLEKQPDILHAEPDYRKKIKSFTSEPRYSDQWYLHNASAGFAAAINLEDAWQIEDGSSNPITVAVIDTGYLPNTPELDNQYIGNNPLNGYDFISADSSGVFITAADGDGRDGNPEDPGDGYSSQLYFDNLSLLGCNNSIADKFPSSWHGTFVAGIIAAEFNGVDIVGVNPNAKILPLRALGRCGGYTSDISDAIQWAAGLNINGISNIGNYKSKVINISLGSLNACSQTEQSAINAAFNAGSVVIVAAGNESTDATQSAPANCDNVLTVAAVSADGGKTSYSNYGSNVDISAPGGYGVYQILSTSNDGILTPGNPVLKEEQGTSFSAPIVSGVISLMLAINPELTPSQIMGTLKATASPFPTTSWPCNSSECGAGIINAKAALEAVKNDNLSKDFSTYSNNTTLTLPIENVRSISGAGSLNLLFLAFLLLLILLRPRLAGKVGENSGRVFITA